MSAARTPEQTMALLARETRCRTGPVPRRFGTFVLDEDSRIFIDGQFALRTDSGYAFHYVPGDGISVERAASADPVEADLWLAGSVYAAIAVLNGLYPFHASAVEHRGAAHAFTGVSGAGKSTLVAALGQRGYALLCDDTMLLDLSDPNRVIALPGHKRLKLTEQALALAGCDAIGQVGSDTGKHYAQPPGGIFPEPLPLASLTWLEWGDAAALAPVHGSQRLAALEDDHYTQHYYFEAVRPAREAIFALRSRLARQVAMSRLTRPQRPVWFANSVDLAEEAIRNFRQEIPI